jgi:antitoxin PrlF
VYESTLTSKGQTTVPQFVRDSLGAFSGVRLVWHVMPDGKVAVRVKNKSITDLDSALSSPKRKTVSLEKLNGWP